MFASKARAFNDSEARKALHLGCQEPNQRELITVGPVRVGSPT
jgi:hypothetical protein